MTFSQVIKEHDDRIASALEALVAAVRAHDREAVQRTWMLFDSRLAAHLQVEERFLIIPMRENPHDAKKAEGMIKDHRRVRKLMADLQASVEGGILRDSLVQSFTDAFALLIRDEKRFLCAWVDKHLDEDQQGRFAQALLDGEDSLMGKIPHRRVSESPSAVKRREEENEWEWKIR